MLTSTQVHIPGYFPRKINSCVYSRERRGIREFSYYSYIHVLLLLALAYHMVKKQCHLSHKTSAFLPCITTLTQEWSKWLFFERILNVHFQNSPFMPIIFTGKFLLSFLSTVSSLKMGFTKYSYKFI